MMTQGLRRSILLSICLLFFAGTLTPSPGGQAVNPEERTGGSLDIDRVRAEMNPLKPSAPSYTPTTAIADYFSYYDLAPGNCRHLFGTFGSQGRTIAGHLFVPTQAKGTIFLLHGYYDHSGIMSRLIAFCLKENLAVAIFDLPGHGLSSGQRFAIKDLADYAATLTAFVNLNSEQLPRPFHLVAHSLGCAIAYEHLHEGNQASFDKVIFLAPLIHSRPWLPTKAIYFMTTPFTNTLPRIHRRNSSDPAFITFVENDPLQQRKVVPMSFISALLSWEKRAQDYLLLDQPLLIIQGDEDVIVDWRYNITFLKTKFSPVQTEIIAGANHQLANENPGLRAELFTALKSYLSR